MITKNQFPCMTEQNSLIRRQYSSKFTSKGKSIRTLEMVQVLINMFSFLKKACSINFQLVSKPVQKIHLQNTVRKGQKSHAKLVHQLRIHAHAISNQSSQANFRIKRQGPLSNEEMAILRVLFIFRFYTSEIQRGILIMKLQMKQFQEN